MEWIQLKPGNEPVNMRRNDSFPTDVETIDSSRHRQASRDVKNIEHFSVLPVSEMLQGPRK